MKIFTMLMSLIVFLISTSYAIADTKQQATLKKFESYGCKLTQNPQGQSAYQCKFEWLDSDAAKSLIKYYSQIVQK